MDAATEVLANLRKRKKSQLWVGLAALIFSGLILGAQVSVNLSMINAVDTAILERLILAKAVISRRSSEEIADDLTNHFGVDSLHHIRRYQLSSAQAFLLK